MAELKTRPGNDDVDAFLNGVEHDTRRADALVLRDVMAEITGEEPTMWGKTIVGFGSYHYVYESGREGDWFLTGFSPRKKSMTLYIMSGFGGFDEKLGRLGKHKTGKSCLYVNKLADVDMDVLKELIESSVAYLRATRPAP
ncbi:MAG: DUF1801 domain-containing protein [Acidobacteriota bacterium]